MKIEEWRDQKKKIVDFCCQRIKKVEFKKQITYRIAICFEIQEGVKEEVQVGKEVWTQKGLSPKNGFCPVD